MSEYLASLDQDVEVFAFVELLKGKLVHNCLQESIEQLHMVYLDDLGQDDLNRSFISEKSLFVLGDKGNHVLDI